MKTHLIFVDPMVTYSSKSKTPADGEKSKATGALGFKLSPNAFIIPEGKEYIVYTPLAGCIILVDATYINNILRLISLKEPTISEIEESYELARIGIIESVDGYEPPEASAIASNSRAVNTHGISLLLTTKCSMRCLYCYASGGSENRTMKWDTARTALDWIFREVASTSDKSLSIAFHGGGEISLVLPLLKRCVSYALALGERTGLKVNFQAATNGIMSDSTARWFSKQFSGVTISLDGIPRVQDRQRPLSNGNPSFEKVSKTLNIFDEEDLKYGVRMTVTPESLPYMAESVDLLARTFKAPAGIQVEPVYRVGRATDSTMGEIDAEEFIRQFRIARSAARQYGTRLKYSGARFGLLTSNFCRASQGAVSVTPDGDITTCYEVADRRDGRAALFFAGSVDAKHESINLDQSRLARLASLAVENKTGCARCFCKWHCAGDCAAKLATLGNAWDTSSNPRCQINRELTLDQIREAIGILID